MDFGSGFGFVDGLIVFALGALMLWPAWRIVAKTGNPGFYSLGLLIPIVNVLLILYLAFSEWPLERERRRAQ